ncbi:MAG: glycosyltransferase family 39 protein [Candidatus Kerfeldbacteria bacterium]|nr:glycosyltransferase family 39 protein [Candidatus Kerfeldbacteria bacterium]
MRVWHLSFGLPAQYAEDEEFFIQPALLVAENLTSFSGWDPQWYGAPAAPLIALLALIFRGMSAILNFFHHTDLPVVLNFYEHLTLFVTAGRIISVAASVGMIFFAYAIGVLYSKKVGLIASACVAFSFYLIQYAHIIRPDTLQACFILGSVYFLLRASEASHRIRWYALSALFFALACTTKFPSAFIAPLFIIVATVQILKEKVWKQWFVFTLVGCGTLFLSAPFVFLHFSETLHDLQFESTTQHAEHMGLSWLGNMLWYIFSVFPWQVGTGVLIIAVYGCVIALYSLNRQTAILGGACFSYLLGISAHELHWERWAIPMTALLFIIAAYGLHALYVRIPRTWMLIVCVCILLAPATRLLRTLIAYTQPTPVALASQYIEERVQNVKIVREPYTPLPHKKTIPNATYHSLGWYRKHNIEYILLGAVYERIERLTHRTHAEEAYIKAARAYNVLFTNAEVIFEQPVYAHDCLYAPDWRILFSLCPRPYFGEGVYILRLR